MIVLRSSSSWSRKPRCHANRAALRARKALGWATLADPGAHSYQICPPELITAAC
jgi:hypothetical protein